MLRISVIAWAGILQWARLGINALVFVVLTRLLSLEDIGTVAIAQAPVLLAQSILGNSFQEYIVQKRRLSSTSISSIFWFAISAGIVFAIFVLILASFIAEWQGIDEIKHYMSALALIPAMTAATGVCDGVMQRNLQTKKLAVRNFIASTVAGGVSIFLAYNSMGGWALVFFSLISASVGLVISIISSNAKPSFAFKLKHCTISLNKILVLGGRHFVIGLTIPCAQYAVGVNIGVREAGIFNIATRLYGLVDSFVMAPYRFVVFPLFSSYARSNKINLNNKILDAVLFAGVISNPAFLFLILLAPVILPIIFSSDNGAASVAAVQIFSIAGLVNAPTAVLKQVLIASGYAQTVFWRAVATTFATLSAVIIASFFSLHAVTSAYAIVGGGVSAVLSVIVCRSSFGLSFSSLIKAWGRPALAAIFVWPVIFLQNLGLDAWTTLTVSIFSFVILYSAGLLLFVKKDIVTLYKNLHMSRNKK